MGLTMNTCSETAPHARGSCRRRRTGERVGGHRGTEYPRRREPMRPRRRPAHRSRELERRGRRLERRRRPGGTDNRRTRSAHALDDPGCAEDGDVRAHRASLAVPRQGPRSGRGRRARYQLRLGARGSGQRFPLAPRRRVRDERSTRPRARRADWWSRPDRTRPRHCSRAQPGTGNGAFSVSFTLTADTDARSIESIVAAVRFDISPPARRVSSAGAG